MTPQQVRQYKETGYTTVRDFFAPPEIAALKRELQRFLGQDLARNVAIGMAPAEADLPAK